MLSKWIITNKDVITRRIDELGFPEFVQYRWKGIDVIGIEQLCYLIHEEVMFRLKDKYYVKEQQKLMDGLELIDVKDKEELKKFFKHVKFID